MVIGVNHAGLPGEQNSRSHESSPVAGRGARARCFRPIDLELTPALAANLVVATALTARHQRKRAVA